MTRSLAARRRRDRALTVAVHAAFGLALLPVVAVVGYTLVRGARAMSIGFLTHSMRGVGANDDAGGIYHSIVGTLEQVLVAGAIAVPLGLLTAIYVTEFGTTRAAAVVRFFVDVMTGIPSIVAGLFVFAFFVLGLHQGFSGLAAGLALAILMLPTVVRSTEEMIRLVPDALREASYALGVPKWRTVLSVVLPTASAGITTGVMLAVARVTGETAPLLLTAHGFNSINPNPVHGPQSGLPLVVFDQAGQASRFAVNRAWAAAATLIALVLALYVGARLATRRSRLATEGR